jgi:hypothetical protein
VGLQHYRQVALVVRVPEVHLTLLVVVVAAVEVLLRAELVEILYLALAVLVSVRVSPVLLLAALVVITVVAVVAGQNKT